MSAQPLANKLYSAHVTANHGRDGGVKSDDGNLDVKLAVPKGLGGPGGAGTNPEQLFAAGYAACFGGAIGHVARTQKLTTGPVNVTANVHIGPAGQAFGLQAEIIVALPEMDREAAQKLIEAAHQVCPYSNATRGNIVVDVKLA